MYHKLSSLSKTIRLHSYRYDEMKVLPGAIVKVFKSHKLQ